MLCKWKKDVVEKNIKTKNVFLHYLSLVSCVIDRMMYNKYKYFLSLLLFILFYFIYSSFYFSSSSFLLLYFIIILLLFFFFFIIIFFAASPATLKFILFTLDFTRRLNHHYQRKAASRLHVVKEFAGYKKQPKTVRCPWILLERKSRSHFGKS